MRWFKEVFLNFRRSGFMSLVSIGTIILAVTALGGYHIANRSITFALESLRQKVEIVVFLNDTTGREKAENIITEAKALGLAEEIKFVSRDDAYQEFVKDPDMQQIMKSFDGNPLPDSINVKLKEYTRDNIGMIVRFFDTKEGVEDIQYGGSEIENLINIMNVIKLIIGAAGGVFLVASILVVSNIIKLTIYARRQDIYIMKMVGASDSFIRMPFIVEGIVHGFIGGAAGWAVLYCIVTLLLSEIKKQTGIDLTTFYLFRPEYFSIKFMLASLGAGCTLGFTGAVMSMGRIFK
ncbi:MAG: ABC transporter permease [Spirochaetia bacterium]|nr:ABC transporter permease [Spirochaetia bacterium]